MLSHIRTEHPPSRPTDNSLIFSDSAFSIFCWQNFLAFWLFSFVVNFDVIFFRSSLFFWVAALQCTIEYYPNLHLPCSNSPFYSFLLMSYFVEFYPFYTFWFNILDNCRYMNSSRQELYTLPYTNTSKSRQSNSHFLLFTQPSPTVPHRH